MTKIAPIFKNKMNFKLLYRRFRNEMLYRTVRKAVISIK